MGLSLYKQESPTTYSEVSRNAQQENPVAIPLEGKYGSAVTGTVYLHNDDPLKTYTSISLTANGATGSGVTFKFYYSPSFSDMPVDAVWGSITTSNTIALTGLTISDSTTYIPIHWRAEVPSNFPLSVITNITFSLSYTES